MQVTGIVVVHNEEALVEACLRSASAVADELIVCHDGPCSDRSVEIARRFTDAVFVVEHRGAPEANAIKMLRRARNHWILKLDCDETLSPGLIRELLKIKAAGPMSGVTHFRAVWRAVLSAGDEHPVLAGEVASRLVLYDRRRTRWVGLPHRMPQVSGKGQGIRECIFHRAPHQSYSMLELIWKKHRPFARADAKLRTVYPLEVFGGPGQPEDQLLFQDRLRWRFPLASAPPLAALAFTRALARCLRFKNATELWNKLRWPIPHGLYQLMLGYQIHRFRRRRSEGSAE